MLAHPPSYEARMPSPRWLNTLTFLLLGACGTDSATDPGDTTLADLAGSWQVVHWEYSRASDPSDKVDWVALQGLTGALAITGSGDFTVMPRLPGGFGQDSGRLTLQGDSLYWDGEDDEGMGTPHPGRSDADAPLARG
jgi:hypothetical protein